ncbi:MAG: LysM domain-containing protein [Myxococcales bacterium]|nr:MAG: LysM domain-containing protein [Myxococcales bacterium]
MRAIRATLAATVILAWVGLASAASSPRYHTIANGQRLGSIAKRYGVSVDAVCTANGIDRNQRLKVGEKLLIPSKDDKDGSLTRRQYGPPERKEARDGATAQTLLASTREPARPSTHTVFAGQRLESIAKRYQVSIDALCDVTAWSSTRRARSRPARSSPFRASSLRPAIGRGWTRASSRY